MEANSNPILPFISNPRWMPDLTYPRHKKWYKTSTYLSPSVGGLTPHTVYSGQHIHDIEVAERVWVDGATAGTRSLNKDIDITTPAYMLAGTTTTDASVGDSLVGLDYYNAPLLMNRDISAWTRIHGLAGADVSDFMGRVLAINHKIHFINYNKHPVRVYYAMMPVGWDFEDLESLTAPSADMRNSQYSSITVPGVLDAGDRAQSRSLNITLNLAKIFPDQYDTPPQINLGDSAGSVDISSSPWFGMYSTHTVNSLPPGQDTAARDGQAVANQHQPPGLRLRLAVKSLAGLNVGPTAAASGTAGTIETNGLVIKADMNWLMDMVCLTQIMSVHDGSKAYPDQTA